MEGPEPTGKGVGEGPSKARCRANAVADGPRHLTQCRGATQTDCSGLIPETVDGARYGHRENEVHYGDTGKQKAGLGAAASPRTPPRGPRAAAPGGVRGGASSAGPPPS
jgi:hypothetical protein